MKSKELTSKRVFLIRLERNEDILKSITEFCKENKIQGGTIQGIGTLSYAKIYSVKDSLQFTPYESGAVELNQPLELVSALGNIALDEKGEPIIHLHITLALPDHSTRSGHLLESKISFAGEFFILETEKLVKKQDGPLKQFHLE